MKNKALLWLGVSLNCAVFAQTNKVASALLLERGASHRVWQTTTPVTNALTGAILTNVAKYTELVNGVCYQDQNQNGQWVDSQDLIELTATGAAAVHGQTKAHFTPNLNTPGAVTLTTVSGQVFALRPVGLYYFDAATGKTALIAALQNSVGVLAPPNQVVYSNAFAGLADVTYVWAHNGFEQNVVLFRSPPPPDSPAFGLNPATTRLELWTEFLNPPAVMNQRSVILKAETDPILRQTMVEPDLVDHLLQFNEFFFPVGAAFLFDHSSSVPLNQPAPIRVPSRSDTNNVFTAKSWRLNGANAVLVESTPYQNLLPKLQALKQAALPQKRSATQNMARAQKSSAVGGGSHQPMKVTQLPYVPKGLVLDFITLSSSQYSYEFYAGTTYYIPDGTAFWVGPGAAYIGNSTCIKYGNNASMWLYGGVTFPQYNVDPAVLTSAGDNSVGAITPTASLKYASSTAIDLYYNTSAVAINNVDIRNASLAVELDENPYAPTCYISNSTFEESNTSILINAASTAIVLDTDTQCNAPNVVNNDSETTTVTGSLTASCTTAPTASFTRNPASGPAPLIAYFTDTSSGGAYPITAWSWNFGISPPGTVDSTQENPSYTYNNIGNYTVRLTVTADNGLSSPQAASATISVPLKVDFSATPPSGAVPVTIQFQDQTSTLNGIRLWDWDFGDGTAHGASQTVPHTYNTVGTYNVTLKITDNLNYQASKTEAVGASPTTLNELYDISQRPGYEAEPTIAINSSDPNNVKLAIFSAISNPTTHSGLFKVLSSDGGTTWPPGSVIADGTSGLPACTGGDVCAVYDKFGNLFLSYIINSGSGSLNGVAVLYSTDDGQSFASVPGAGQFVATIGPLVDQPWLATGPSGLPDGSQALWLTYADGYPAGSAIKACSAKVSGIGASGIGTFGAIQTVYDQHLINPCDFLRIAVGPSGQVMCVFTQHGRGSGPSDFYYSINTDEGTGSAGFSSPVTIIPQRHLTYGWSSFLGNSTYIPAQPLRLIDINPSLAWNRSAFLYPGRVYLVYTDSTGAGSYDTDIYIMYSDNNGTTWSESNNGHKINTELNGSSQFWPAIAVDQATGYLGVGWYDARFDKANIMVQYCADVSKNGGLSFLGNIPLTPWPSNANLLTSDWMGGDFLDYTAFGYWNGILYGVWADNSGQPPLMNPDNQSKLDLYLGKYHY